METRANHLIVGAFVILFVLGAMGFVLWLAKYQADREVTRFNIITENDVTGLKAGSPVRYKGVRVGEVVLVQLSPSRPSEEIVVLIEVEATTPVKTDTIAMLQIEGITGSRAIQLSQGSEGAEPLKETGPYGHPVIPAQSSPFDELLESAPELIASANVLVARGNDMLNDQNRLNIAKTLENIQKLTAALAEKESRIRTLVDDGAVTMSNMKEVSVALKDFTGELEEGSEGMLEKADHALTSLDSAASSIDKLVGESSTDVRELMRSLRGTADSFARTSDQLESMIRENREPIRDFTSTGLYELSSLLTETRALVRDLKRLSTEVERDPARFFFGDQQQGYETEQ